MSQDSTLDLPKAHRHFSAFCFNEAWKFIDRPDRTEDDEEKMLHLAMASHWHWMQRPDYAPLKASIGYWQISRVFALMSQPDNARRFGNRALSAAERAGNQPFYQGYAHEALARAEAVAGNEAAMKRHLDQARRFADQVTQEDDRKVLVADLDALTEAGAFRV